MDKSQIEKWIAASEQWQQTADEILSQCQRSWITDIIRADETGFDYRDLDRDSDWISYEHAFCTEDEWEQVIRERQRVERERHQRKTEQRERQQYERLRQKFDA